MTTGTLSLTRRPAWQALQAHADHAVSSQPASVNGGRVTRRRRVEPGVTPELNACRRRYS